MKRITILPLVFALALVSLAACGGEDDDDGDDGKDGNAAAAETTLCPMSSGRADPFEDALVFIEFNSTDEDLGFHATFDASGWKEAVICGPDGSKLFEVNAGGSTNKHGLSELFFEGAEPPLDEQPVDEFIARFPKGEYMVVGKTTKGDALISTATFTHNIPDGPVIISPKEDGVVDMDAVVIAWEPVTSPPGIEIVRYELSFAPEDPEERDPPPALDIDLFLELPSTVTEFRIPPELPMPDTEYVFEVLTVEVSGNKTITEVAFFTAGAAP